MHAMMTSTRWLHSGLRVVALPLLWEGSRWTAGAFDWAWTNRRLARMRELGLDPSPRWCRHGSGPAWTSLTEPGFAAGLTHYARLVAERYPWVRRYTDCQRPSPRRASPRCMASGTRTPGDDRQVVQALLNGAVQRCWRRPRSEP